MSERLALSKNCQGSLKQECRRPDNDKKRISCIIPGTAKRHMLTDRILKRERRESLLEQKEYK